MGDEKLLQEADTSDSQQLLPSQSLASKLLDKASHIPCAGIVLAVISGIIFATGSFIVKLVPNINPLEVVIARGIIQMIVLMPVILWYRMPVMGHPGQRLFVLLRGLSGAINLTAAYASFRLMPLADASTIIFASPALVYIIGCLFMREECGIFQILTVMVTMTGVVLISNPSLLVGQEAGLSLTHDDPFSRTRMAGATLALISCILAASSFLLVRKLKDCPPPVVVNSYAVGSIICGTAIILIAHNFFPESSKEWGDFSIPKTSHDIGLLLGNGACSLAAQILLTLALRMEEASLVSLSRTMDVVMAFVFQMIWLPDEVVHWTSFVGALIVCSCVSLATLRRWLEDKVGKYNTLWLVINCGTERSQVLVADP